jgi:ElaB/YqjD/DUF883 family membrane-anchored ribosome-binding protein
MNTMSPAHTGYAGENLTASERANERASELRNDARTMAAHAKESMQQGIDDLRHRARYVADEVRYRANDLNEATRHRIQDAPMKSIAVAAAVGVVATLLVQWLSRPRHY